MTLLIASRVLTPGLVEVDVDVMATHPHECRLLCKVELLPVLSLVVPRLNKSNSLPLGC